MLEDKVAHVQRSRPKTVPCNGSATRLVPQSEVAAWKGSIISNIGNIAIPEPDIVLPPTSVSNNGTGNPGVYWDKADLRIVLHVGVDTWPGRCPAPFRRSSQHDRRVERSGTRMHEDSRVAQLHDGTRAGTKVRSPARVRAA
jgi:hypothetical protein